MQVHRKISATFFLIIVTLAMTFESMPHLIHDYSVHSNQQAGNIVHSNESASTVHSIFHIIESLSKAHAANPHEHNATLTKASDKKPSTLYFPLLFTVIPLIQQVLSTEERTYCTYTRPLLYKSRFASTWALRGPPSRI